RWRSEEVGMAGKYTCRRRPASAPPGRDGTDRLRGDRPCRMDVPPTLRTWFVAHAAVSLLAAAPLLAAPELALHRLGWAAVDPIVAGLAGAALLAIGGQSMIVRKAGPEAYRTMLGLLVIWSLAAALGLFVGIGAGAPPAAWALLSIFILFAGVWVHHAIRFRQLERATDSDEAVPTGDDAVDETD